MLSQRSPSRLAFERRNKGFKRDAALQSRPSYAILASLA